jgi:hypothetical protein
MEMFYNYNSFSLSLKVKSNIAGKGPEPSESLKPAAAIKEAYN